MVPGPAAVASCGNLLNMQILGPIPDLWHQKLWGQAQQWFSCMLKFENHWSIMLNIVSSILTYDDRSSDHFRDKGKIQFWFQNAFLVTTFLISFYNWNLCCCILFTNWLFRRMQVFLLKFKHTHTSSSVYWTK